LTLTYIAFTLTLTGTRYTRALEAFQKSKKEFASKAKDLKGEMMELGAHLQSVQSDKHSLKECEEQQEETQGAVDDYITKVEQVQERLDNYKTERSSYFERRKEHDDIILRMDDLSARIADKQAEITLLDDTDDEALNSLLFNFEEEMKIKSVQLQSLRQQIDQCNEEISQSRQRSDELQRAKGAFSKPIV